MISATIITLLALAVVYLLLRLGRVSALASRAVEIAENSRACVDAILAEAERDKKLHE